MQAIPQQAILIACTQAVEEVSWTDSDGLVVSVMANNGCKASTLRNLEFVPFNELLERLTEDRK